MTLMMNKLVNQLDQFFINMNSDRSKKQLTPEEWDSKLLSLKIPKQQINKLVMDYLITEGFSEAALNFSKECSVPLISDDSLESRDQIRASIYLGEIDKAVLLINTLSPSILITNPNLLFSLRIQKLVIYIRENKISEALAYGQEVLAPTALGNKVLLAELEKALSLLAFTDFNSSSLIEISSPLYKLKLANEVNLAILKFFSKKQTPSINNLCKVFQWTSKKLEKTISFPKQPMFPENLQ